MIISNGYGDLLWELLVMDNGQGKEIIYKNDYSTGAETVNSIINEIDESRLDLHNAIKVDQLEHWYN